MKTNRLYTTILVFSILTPNSGYSSGQGSGASRSKTISAKDCSEGTEYKIKNKGVWGCYPKKKAEVDPSCDEDTLKSLQAKKGCLVDNNPQQCSQLAILGAAGVARSSASGISAKILNAQLESQGPSAKARFQGVIDETAWHQKKLYEFHKMTQDVYNENTRKAKIPDYLKTEYSALSPRSPYEKFLEYGDTYVTEGKKIDEASKKQLVEKIKQYPDAKTRDFFSKLVESGFEYSPKEFVAKSATYNALKEQFPNEFEKLKPLFERFDTLEKWYIETASKGRKAVYLGRVSGGLAATYEEFNYQNSRIRADLAEILKSATPEMRLVAELGQYGNFITDKAGRDPKLGWPKYGKEIDEKLAKEAQDAKSRVAPEPPPKKESMAGKGAATVVALLAGAEISNSLLGQGDIRNCQKEFGFSDQEIEFLGNRHFFTVAKASKKDGWGCDSLTLDSPTESLAELQSQFGGIPKGICKMLKQQDSKLDALLGDSSSNPKVSCDRITDANYSVFKDDSGKNIFEYRDGQYTYKAPLLAGRSYPDFRFMKVFDETGNEVSKKSTDIQVFYSKFHPAGKPDSTPDITDMAFGSSENSNNGNLFQRMRQYALRARVGLAINSQFCGSPEVSSVGGPDAATTGADGIK